VDDLLDRTRGFVSDFAFDFVRRPVEHLLRRAMDHATKHAVAAALFALGAAFLLWAGAEGLIALGTPRWAAHAVIALVSGGAAWLILRTCCGPDDRD
jgi:hypothetical protein